MHPMPALELVPQPEGRFGVLGRSTLDQVIDGGHLSLAFQPIVHGGTRRVLGYEALARCPSKFFDTPQALLRAAAEAGRSGELGRLLRELAIRECSHAPLFLNIIPNEFNDPWLVRPDDPIFRHKHPVYLEIVESVPLDYFEQCHSVLAELRKKGARLAIDDFGSGFSNVKYIADLEPEIVKFDRKLIAGLTMDSRSFRLVESLVRLCRDMGSEVVAEGVETVNEFGAVLRAGVDYCQGYFFGYPGRPGSGDVC
jgi:EAL domain-containing protein (putative c-di-GMP-specific phosphodiesterase class I)